MNLKKLAMIAAFAAFSTNAAMAANFAEGVDAGQTLATAQVLGGGTDSITGALSGDADIFKFAWGGGAFYADTLGSNFDTQLFLFDSTGAGIRANDDGLTGLRSYIDPILAAGIYYLAISGFDNDPISASGIMFQSSPYSPQYGPNFPGETLQSWVGGGDTGSYIINFRSESGEVVQTGEVPEPASVALLGMGLFGLFAAKRKQVK